MASSESFAPHFATDVRERGALYVSQGVLSPVRSDLNTFCAQIDDHTSVQACLEWRPGGGTTVLAACDCGHPDRFCAHLWAALLAADTCGWLGAHEHVRAPALVWQPFTRTTDAADNKVQLAASNDAWRRSLEQIVARASREERENRQSTVEREAWYVLNLRASQREDWLIIDYHNRQKRPNGDFGKLKKQSLLRDDIRTFSDPHDRRLLELLLGNPPDPKNLVGFDDGETRQDSSRVSPALLNDLLPELCATGRFVYRERGGTADRSVKYITWDRGDAWRCRLNIFTNVNEGHWHVTALFVRGTDVVEATAVELVLSRGLVLLDGVLAKLEFVPGEFAWIAALVREPHIRVPFTDREAFLELWWSAPHQPDIELPPELRLEHAAVTPTGRFTILGPMHTGEHKTLHARIEVDYEGFIFDPNVTSSGVVDETRNRVVAREKDAESALLERVGRLGVTKNTGQYFDRGDYEFAKDNLENIVTTLLNEGWFVQTESGRVKALAQPRLSVTTGADWFDLKGDITFDDTPVSIPALLQAAKDNNWQIKLSDDSAGLLPHEWLARFETLARLGEKRTSGIRFRTNQALLLDSLLDENTAVLDDGFLRWRKKLQTFSGVTPRAPTAGFVGTLRPYQKEGLGWLRFLREFRLGGCLADDMGLGKTVQALALLEYLRTAKLKKGEQRLPSLVVVPRSLVFNWLAEAERFTPKLKILRFVDKGRALLLDKLSQHHVVLTTYTTLRLDIATLRQLSFEYAILDESQAIKNPQSQTSKAARLVNARHRLAMTATPVENNLTEIWSLFEFLNPGILGGVSRFGKLVNEKRFEKTSPRSALAAGLRPFILRRNKSEVLKDLPKKTEQTLLCTLGGTQRKAYDELLRYYRSALNGTIGDVGFGKAKIHVLEALLRLRQAACHTALIDAGEDEQTSAKFEMLGEHLDEILASDNKALIFSQFTSLLGLLRSQLSARGIDYEYLDGRTRNRELSVKRFQNEPDCRLFLLSLKAGGHGLNLTAADYIFILDPWWNPAIEAQAIGRAHRIGQRRPVFAYRLIAKDTVEEKIIELQQRKKALAQSLVSADNALMRDLTAEDLRMLLS